MSFASRMLIKLLQVSGMKGKLARGSQKTFEEAVSYNRKHPFVMPEDHKAIYEQINIRTGFGVYPCLKISQPDSCRDRAVLFTWGGGGLLNAWKSQLGMAVKLGRDAKVPVYYPIYPLATEHSLLDTMEMIVETYGKRWHLQSLLSKRSWRSRTWMHRFISGIICSMHFRFIRSAGNRERLTAIFWLISEDRYDWKKRHHAVR